MNLKGSECFASQGMTFERTTLKQRPLHRRFAAAENSPPNRTLARTNLCRGSLATCGLILKLVIFCH
jgi:hypothetical protein